MNYNLGVWKVMKILTIMGTCHNGNTRAITDLTRFFFKIFGMTQKNGWNKTDADYWKNKGWLNRKKPF